VFVRPRSGDAISFCHELPWSHSISNVNMDLFAFLHISSPSLYYKFFHSTSRLTSMKEWPLERCVSLHWILMCTITSTALLPVHDFIFSPDRYHGFWGIDLNPSPKLGACWSGCGLSWVPLLDFWLCRLCSNLKE
jgi:hypothetical protein